MPGHPRIFVDIGAAVLPASMATWGKEKRRVYQGSDIYIGVDSGYEADAPLHSIKGGYDEAHKELAFWETHKNPRHEGENIFFVGAKGQELPLADRSVHEIIIGNVLGAPISPHSAWGILSEAHRVLQDNGQIIVNESITPVPDYWLRPLLLSTGFKITDLIQRDEGDYKRIAQMEDELGLSWGEIGSKTGYICFVQKATEAEQRAILTEVESDPAPLFGLVGEKRPWKHFLEQLPGFKYFQSEEAYVDWLRDRSVQNHQKLSEKKYFEDKVVELGAKALRWAGRKAHQKTSQVLHDRRLKKLGR